MGRHLKRHLKLGERICLVISALPGLAGFAVGLALRKIGRIALVIFGLLFITLQVLAYAGIVHVDWLRIQNYATPVLEKNALQKTWNDFMGILTNNVPFGAAFIPGLLLGLRFG